MGGLERQLVLLARALRPAWDPAVWTVDGGPYADIVREAGLPLRIAGRKTRLDVTPSFELWRVLREARPAVVHSWHWMSSAAALPACRSLGVPLVDGSIRRGDLPHERWRPHACLPLLADMVVANSQAGLRAYGVSSDRGRVIYNAFDESRLKGVRADRVPDVFTVVMAARMAPDKDFRSVIAAARLLVADDRAAGRDMAPCWRFRLVGNGPERDRLLAMSQDLVDLGHLEFIDGGLEPLGYVAGADVGVLMTDPTRLAEGCSNSILEYMACGLPVVCADSGGNREVVLDGRTGFVIPSGSATALADRLRRLRIDPLLAEGMGTTGRRRVADLFNLHHLVEAWSSVYAELTGC